MRVGVDISEEYLRDYVFGTNWDYKLAELQVQRLSNDKEPQKQFLVQSISQFKKSPQFNMMGTAWKYLINENEEIMSRTRELLGDNGEQLQSPLLTNTKLSHPFLHNLTEQKVNFLLGREMSVEVPEGHEEYSKELSKYFDKRFMRQLRTLAKSAIPYGIAWLQMYYNTEGELKFKRIPSDEVVPFWADSDHTVLDAVIRFYDIEEIDEEGRATPITKIEYYTPKGVWRYVVIDNEIHADPVIGDRMLPHFSMTLSSDNIMVDGEDSTEEYPMSWGKVPFVAFKYNEMEISLLQWVKPQIDDYDRLTSDVSNNIKDFPESFKMVKGYSGEGLGEFNRMIATHRVALLDADENADMKILTTEMNYVGQQTVFERLSKDIYTAGKGVNPQDQSFSHVNGVAIRSKYQLLSQDCYAMGGQFQEAMEQMLYFINLDLRIKGVNIPEGNVDFIFNTDALLNESEIINNLVASAPFISRETFLANHPYITNVQEEIRRKEEDEKKMADQLQSMMPNSQFGVGANKTQQPTTLKRFDSIGNPTPNPEGTNRG